MLLLYNLPILFNPLSEEASVDSLCILLLHILINVNKFKSNKSDLRIAPEISSQISSPSPSNCSSSSNNSSSSSNNNNNIYNNIHISSDSDILSEHSNINSPNIDDFCHRSILPNIFLSPPIINNRFSPHRSLSSIDNDQDLISFSILNVKRINTIVKFDIILNSLFNKNLSIFSLTETRLAANYANPMFRNYCTLQYNHLFY
jgi:hypothetical protein